MAKPLNDSPHRSGPRATAETGAREPENDALPHRAAREAIRAGLAEAAQTGVPVSQILSILMSETLPRLINAYGSANAALILDRLGHEVRTGSAPHFTRQ